MSTLNNSTGHQHFCCLTAAATRSFAASFQLCPSRDTGISFTMLCIVCCLHFLHQMMWVLIEYIDVKSVWRKGMWRRPASKTILSSHLPTRDPRYWVWRQKPPPRALAALCHQRLLLQKGFSFYFPHFPTGLRLHGGQEQLGIHLVSAHPVPQPCYGLRYADMYLYIRFISFFIYYIWQMYLVLHGH